jgi:uncharacterized protein with FMN-binding domain
LLSFVNFDGFRFSMPADSQLSGASWDIATEAIQETDPRLKNQRGNAIHMKQIALSLFVIAASGAYVWDQAGKNSGDIMLDSALPAGAVEAHAVQPVAPSSAAAMPAIPTEPARRETRLTTRASTASEMASAISTPSESRVLPATSPAAVRAAPQPSPSPIKQTIVPAMIRPPAPTPSFVATPATYVPIPQHRPAYPDTAAPVVRVGMKLGTQGYADGAYTGPIADAYYGIVQIQALVQDGRLAALKVLQYPSDRRTSIRINRQALPMLRDEAISAQDADVDILSGATLTSKAFIRSLGGALKKASS